MPILKFEARTNCSSFFMFPERIGCILIAWEKQHIALQG
jgi:hypothetical protein